MLSLSKLVTFSLLSHEIQGAQLLEIKDPITEVSDAVSSEISKKDLAELLLELPVGSSSPYQESRVGADPDMYRSFDEIVTENGYTSEHHPVVTKDGYQLNLYRIKSKNFKPGSKVIFLQHGITDSADGWIMNYPNKSVAFRLVEAGYDVWLGNQRGTKYSIGHQFLDTKSKEYWSFSWSEMGDYDAVAQVDYALKHADQKKMVWIGHSQGTTQMFHALSSNQQYWDDRMELFIGIAPVTALKHCSAGLFKKLSWSIPIVEEAANILGIYEILGPLASDATVAFCSYIPWFCKEFEGFVITHDPEYDNSDRF